MNERLKLRRKYPAPGPPPSLPAIERYINNCAAGQFFRRGIAASQDLMTARTFKLMISYRSPFRRIAVPPQRLISAATFCAAFLVLIEMERDPRPRQGARPMAVAAPIPVLAPVTGMLTVGRGATLLLLDGRPAQIGSQEFNNFAQSQILGIPVPIICSVLVLIVCGIVLNKTPFGRYLYATGSDLDAAYLSGIRTDFVRFCTFVISGLLAGFGGVFLASRLFAATLSSARAMSLTPLQQSLSAELASWAAEADSPAQLRAY